MEPSFAQIFRSEAQGMVTGNLPQAQGTQHVYVLTEFYR
jgi:hypothetical protein